MVLAAAGIALGLLAFAIYVRLWWRVEADKQNIADLDRAQADRHHDELLAALVANTEVLSLLAAKPLPKPPDLTFLHDFVEEQSRALQARMDTINADMAVLTTRVETGPGRRTINFP